MNVITVRVTQYKKQKAGHFHYTFYMLSTAKSKHPAVGKSDMGAHSTCTEASICVCVQIACIFIKFQNLAKFRRDVENHPET